MKYRKSNLQIAKLKTIEWLQSDISDPIIPEKYNISKSRLAKFEDVICGKIVYPWSKGYEDDRKEFNNVYDSFPLLIVYVSCYEDIRYSLELARSSEIAFCIRSGGHSLADYSVCDGIVIDVSSLNSISVNRTDNTLLVESGCTFEKIFPVIEQYGLHMPGGGCPTVAVAGFMQGGGYGLTSRNFGMNCDNVLSVTVMLADGRIVIANLQQNIDLYWAIRGGTGGNFGVLLDITYQLHVLGEIWGSKITYPIDPDPEIAAQALFTLQQNYLTPNTYPQLGIETVISADSDGRKKIFFCTSWIGDEGEYDAVLAPMLSIPGAKVVLKERGKYSKVNADVLDGTPSVPEDIKAYSQSTYIGRNLSQSEWKDILQFFLTAPNKYTMIDLECYGGAINNVPLGSNAFIHRDVLMDFFCDAFFNAETNDQRENEIWLTKLFEFMSQYSNGHSYQNYPNRNQENFRWAYWGNYYNQLVRIKNKYDPQNYFKYQQSIGPEEEGSFDQNILFKPEPIIYEPF